MGKVGVVYTGREKRARVLFSLPFFPTQPGLSQDANKQTNANIASMRIGQCQTQIAFYHIFMLPAGVRPHESQSAQPPNKFFALYRF